VSKRLFDLLVASVGLLVTAPVMAIVTLVILAGRGGPILFRQRRIGRGGQPFTILKFRTMRPARPGAASITVGQDARITRVGHLLRQTKIDELPQLFNVIRGDMSLVGPRPEVPEYHALYDPALRDWIISVRPGITDRASIIYRNEAELLARQADPDAYYRDVILPHKQAIAADYAQHHSLWGDIGIIVDTIKAVADRSGGAR
jgi:lipopolysaccharide/colanic/teichoic acid biosynthesis glycosyltransferase